MPLYSLAVRITVSAILAASFALAACNTPTPLPAKPAADHKIARKPMAQTAAPAVMPPEKPAAATASTTPTAPVSAPRYFHTEIGGIALEAVAFDSRSHRLIVADQPNGPGSQWPDARATGTAAGGLAAINGGFFTPEGAPLGLVIHHGKRTGSVNRASSLGTGAWVDEGGAPRLVRREALPAGASELLQAGPFLVESGRTLSGLSTQSSSARSFIAWDGGSRWIIGRTGPCSLAELGQALAKAQPAGWTIRHALNLDGGRSSELWVSSSVSGGPAFTRPFYNKPVRNHLVLTPR